MKEKASMGRPPKAWSWSQLDRILECHLSLQSTASIMETSKTVVRERIQTRYGMTFRAYRQQKMCVIKKSLIQKAIEMALSGDRTMLIFCLKNICGWSDSPADVKEMKKKVDQLIIQYSEIVPNVAIAS